MNKLENIFFKVFGTNAEYLYRAPGRVNLIGEHIDYNGGTVLPIAISRYVYLYVSTRKDNLVKISSTIYNTVFERNLDDVSYKKEDDWATYAFGVFYILNKLGYHVPNGLNILIDSTIPIASGLSSSSAFLDAMLFMLNDLFAFKIDTMELIKIAKQVENEYCGVSTGIMDQSAIMLGKSNKAILINTRDVSYEYTAINLENYSLVVLQTNKERRLVNSKYNERVNECNEAIKLINGNYRNIKYLTDITVNELSSLSFLDENLLKRVRHIVTEQKRVYDFASALRKKDYVSLGNILNKSHESLKIDYEVTGENLDTICELARENGALGARMTGAGFGGCALAIVKKSDFPLFKEKVSLGYKEKLGINSDIYIVDIVDGPEKMKL